MKIFRFLTAFQLLAALHVSAADVPMPKQARVIPHSIGIHVTEAGQNFIQQELISILKLNQVNLNQGDYPDKAIHFEKPFTAKRIQALLAGRPNGKQAAETFSEIQRLFSAWLKGIQIKPPLVSLKLSGLNYRIEFDTFGFKINPAATLKSGPKSLAFDFQIQTRSLDIQIKKFRIHDSVNSFLNPTGLNHPSLVIPKSSRPLQIRIPFVIRFNSNDQLEFQAYPATSNISKVLFDLRFGQLELPEIAITYTDELGTEKEVVLNKKGLNAEIAKLEPQLVASIQEAASGFISNELHKELNVLFKDQMAQLSKPVLLWTPAPGAPSQLPETDSVIFGMQVSDLRLPGPNLYTSLGAFFEDPLAKSSTALTQKIITSRFPSLQNVGPEKIQNSAHAWIAVNDTFINRLLQLGFERNYFEKLDIGGGSHISLTKMPIVKLDGSLGPKYAIVETHAKYVLDRTDGDWDWFATKGRLNMKFNLVLRIENTGKNVRIIQDHVDLNSFWIDPNDIRYQAASVRKSVLKKFEAANLGMKKTQTVLVDGIPLPDDFLGLDYRFGNMIQSGGFQWVAVNLVKPDQTKRP